MFRLRAPALFLGGYVIAAAVWACSSSPTTGFNNDPDGGGTSSGSGGGSGGSGSGGSGSGGGNNNFEGGLGGGPTDGGGSTSPEASITVTTTMYAVTEDSLYSVDPTTNQATIIGPFQFSGVADASSSAYVVTDVAVDAEGDVYVNTETEVYKAVLPSGSTGTVMLTNGVAIAASAGTNGAYFYALGFTPAGALGAGSPEYLIGGDGSGNLWSIDPSTGASKELGNFGNDPGVSGNFMGLSGDIVFYETVNEDGGISYEGLATIRSCTPNSNPSYSPTCNKFSDYLAGVDMGALANAFSSGTPATSLNAGIYGGSSTALGAGIGHGDMFGLAAVGTNVVGFSKDQTGDAAAPPQIWTINATPTSGAGTLLPQTFSFTNGWAGAAVTSKVTITVPPPPPPPPAPK